MSKLLFTLSCIEFYAEHIGKTGKEVYCMLKKEKLLYILTNNYEYFRSVGMEHLMNYIDFNLRIAEAHPKRTKSHAAVRSLLICEIVRSIAKMYKTDEEEALNRFYSSKTALEFCDDETGLYANPAAYTFSLFCKEYDGKLNSSSVQAFF